MGLHLSSTDQALLAKATRQLLSPLDYEHVDDWRRDAISSLREVLGADMGTFMVPVEDAAAIYAEGFGRLGMGDYLPYMESLDRQYRFRERAIRLGAFNRQMLFGAVFHRYLRSTYYNEIVVPRRAFDCIGMYIRARARAHDSDSFVLFHHDSPQKQPFGDRGLSILRVVTPVLKAGVDSLLRLRTIRSAFGRLLDGIGEAIILFDRSGKLLHMTPRASELLRPDRGPQLREAIARVVRGLAAGTPLTDVVTTSSGGYAVRGTYAGEQLLSGAPGILVTIEPPERPVRFDEERVRERFQLTRQEARVALLLAERKTNAEIAETLCISPHTARHHTERVLSKLGISSRKEVTRVISQSGSDHNRGGS